MAVVEWKEPEDERFLFGSGSEMTPDHNFIYFWGVRKTG